MKYWITFYSFILISCSTDLADPQKIIDNAIEVAGGDKFLNSTIEFDFRNRHYVSRRNGGTFSHERIFKDSANNTIHDFLTNDGFRREINNQPVTVPDTMAAKYTRSVNSTIYFALLPYGLNDAAVKKKFVGKTILDNQPYYIVEVTFGQEGGGEDFNDIFLYWIHEEKFAIDYMAYVYFTEGGGLRFRKALNPRKVNGVLLQDYINYQPTSDSVTIYNIESSYKVNALEELSKIELTNIVVH